MLFRLFFLATGILLGGTTFLFPVRTAQAERLYVNTNPLFEACLQRCEEQTPLGDLTRRGCYKGCAEIRRSFGISRSYRSMAACIEDINDLELERDLVIERHQAWCDREWPHLHKRKGCKDAMEVYIRAATVNSICYHQQPEAIARQTPRTTMTMRHYPAAVSAAPRSPASPGPAMPLSSVPGTFSGDVLSMPPVYDTPKYSQTRSKTVRKTVSSSASATSGVSRAPSLAPPPKTAQPAARTAPKTTPPTATKTSSAVPVITPSTATARQQPHSPAPSGPVEQTHTPTAQNAQSATPPDKTPGTTPVPPAPPAASLSFSRPAQPGPAGPLIQPDQPGQPGQPNQTSQTGQREKAGQTTQSEPADYTAQQGQNAQTTAPQQATPARTPVINAATEPVSPPVISSPMPVLPDLSAATPATSDNPATPARLAPTSPPAGQRPLAPATSVGLLPSLQPSSTQSGQTQPAQGQTASMP